MPGAPASKQMWPFALVVSLGAPGCSLVNTFDELPSPDGAPVSVCGDGVIGAGEECDDANDVSGDGCELCQVVCDIGPDDPVTRHCYGVPDFGAGWGSANGECAGLGGQLVGISSQAEHNLVLSFGAGAVWTGGNDIAVEGTFVWVNGETWAFDAWGQGEPAGGIANNCVGLDGSGKFNDFNCGDQMPFLCERPPPGTPGVAQSAR